MKTFPAPVLAACLGSVLLLSACAPHVGVGIPVGPFSIGVGMGSGGVSAGVGTGVGPVGVGVGVHQSGQVTGHAGVGASVPVGPARVGAGVGGSTVLHSPNAQAQEAAPTTQPSSSSTPQKIWRDAQGNVVPQCRIEGRC